MPKTCLTEAKQHMTDTEKRLHRRLIRLLLDDGKGHHHKKYAQRLKDFNLKIVPLKVDPNFTAGIVFDLGIIYLSEGFLADESLFYQLNVLMRHELAHNLLMHQIRMMSYIGKTYSVSWGNSSSMHDILNIIEDMEISHTIYNKEDMETVRNMYLNGRTIGGILTEDQRPEWLDMPLEVMFNKLCTEIDALHAQITQGINSAISHHTKPDDLLTREITGMMNLYGDVQSMSILDDSLDTIAANGFKLYGKEFRPDLAPIIKDIYRVSTDSQFSETDVESLIQDIKDSHPIKKLDLIHPYTGELITVLYTPEQKQFAIEVLKKCRSEEVEWYNAVMSVMKRNNYSAQTVKDIWDRTRGNSNGND